MPQLNIASTYKSILRFVFCASVGYAVGFDRGCAIGLAVGAVVNMLVEIC